MTTDSCAAAERRVLIEAIHDTPTKLVIVATGGGASAIADLLSVPGASRTVIEAVVPYTVAAQAPWLLTASGGSNAQTAADMAQVAAQRASVLDPNGPTLGVACTAALATDRDRRGRDRAHLAVAEVSGVTHQDLVEMQRETGRAGQERLVSDALLQMCATAVGVETSCESNDAC